MRHEHFPVFHPPYSCYFLQLLIVIVSFRFLHCNVVYLAHAYILYFQISNCNVFVYVTLAFLRYPIVTVFIVTTFADQVSLKHALKKKGRAFRNIGTEKYISQTVKSALLLYYLFYNLLLIRSFTTQSGTFILSRWSLLVPLLVFTEHFPNIFRRLSCSDS